MQLTLCNLSKRLNSTKQPTAAQLAAGKTFNNVTLKEITNIDNPVLKLAGASDNDYAYNYAYIHDWGRYYHVKTADLRHEDIYSAKLELDDLATYKAQILATSAFVLYSSSDYSDLLIDDRVAMLTDVDITIDNSNSSPFSTTPSYLLTVVGEQGVQVLKPSDPNVIPATLYQQTVSDLVAALCIQWSDAQSCMLELKEVPMNIGSELTLNGYVGKIDVGSRPALNPYFNDLLYDQTVMIHIPVTYNDFRLFKFVTAHLYLPFVGVVEIDLQAFYPDPTAVNQHVIIYAAVNPLTGSVVYSLKNDDGEIVATYSGSFGRTIPINASSPRDAIGSIQHIMSAAAGIGSGRPATAIAESINAITDAVHFRGSTVGSFSGSFGEYIGTNYILSVEKHNSNIEPSNLNAFAGRPCGKVRSLAGLTGFVQTQGFSIELPANSDVVKSINSKLDAGIYIE